MPLRHFLRAALIVGAATLFATVANASHFRGGAMIPTIDSSGLLTVTSTSFWRPTSVSSVSPTANGFSMSQVSSTQDTSDSRFTVVRQVHTLQLSPGAQTVNILAFSCCRVGGIQNANQSNFNLDSTIVWNGSSANTPILFDFSAIQPEVVRGQAYNDNLGAVSGNGGTLTYDQDLNININSQPPGFTVNATTGALNIPAANTATYLDNPTSNEGADYAFSGNIRNSDGSSVEFDWLFDAVDVGAVNLAPNVSDHVINALIGDTINQAVTGTDPNTGDTVTLSLLSIVGSGINLTPTFTPGAPGNPTSGNVFFDTTGSAPGTVVINVRGSDGSLTDVGSVTVNLRQGGPAPDPTPVPEPGSLTLLATGLLGLGFAVRRRRRK